MGTPCAFSLIEIIHFFNRVNMSPKASTRPKPSAGGFGETPGAGARKGRATEGPSFRERPCHLPRGFWDPLLELQRFLPPVTTRPGWGEGEFASTLLRRDNLFFSDTPFTWGSLEISRKGEKVVQGVTRNPSPVPPRLLSSLPRNVRQD